MYSHGLTNSVLAFLKVVVRPHGSDLMASSAIAKTLVLAATH